MYIYNKQDKSYTFSLDDLDINEIIDSIQKDSEVCDDFKMNNENNKKIEVITGGNDLKISPVTNYIEVEKPKNIKKENIVIPENKTSVQ